MSDQRNDGFLNEENENVLNVSEETKAYEDIEDISENIAEEANAEIDNISEETESVVSDAVDTEAEEAIQNSENEAKGVSESPVSDEKTASALEVKPVKKKGCFKKLAALCAGVVVVGAVIGAGVGAGNYLYNSGGVVAASGSDVNLGAEGEREVSPIVYTTNFNSISEVFKSVESAVVNINITVNTTNFWNQTYEAKGSGSGIIYKIDGDDVYIVTNNHVVDGAKTVSVSVTGEEQLFATLVGKDAENDLAVIKVSKDAFTSAGITDIKAAEFVAEDSTDIGETVLAIGNALGKGKTVTMGIISAKNKNISVDGKNLTVIQTDAAINPGNSGGALVNLDGRVIGINTAKTGSQVIEGTGYAIPSYVAVGIFNELIEKGTVEKPYLGVVCYTINDTFRQMYNLDVTGVFIQEISQGSAAEKAGLRATDIITSVNGTPIATQQDLQNAINGHAVGDSITIGFLRNGREAMTVTAVLENYNAF